MQGRTIEETIRTVHHGKIYALERKVRQNVLTSGHVEVVSFTVNHNPDKRDITVLEASDGRRSYADRTRMLDGILDSMENLFNVFRIEPKAEK